MRVLVFHGYLLGGTGSNVYNARLAEALVRLGHEVHLICQERHPADHGFVDAAGDWDGGELVVRELRERSAAADVGSEAGGAAPSGRCTVYRPDIGGLLPVYVADRYEGIEARRFADCTDDEVARYIEANVAAVREVSEAVRPDVALANHLVMGPVILARGLAGAVPFAVKVHGSALEYTVKPEPERFGPFAREGVEAARGVLVGSRHTAESLWAALGLAGLPERTRLGPPGVDVQRFVPREPAAAAAGVRELAQQLQSAPEAVTGSAESAFARDARSAGAALARLDPGSDVLVAYVGKLIVSKGVDLLMAAWPLVLEQVPVARLVVVGFGAYREALERLVDALADSDLAAVRALAQEGRAAESQGAEAAPLRHLTAFLDSLEGDARRRYLAAAARVRERIVLTGRLDHEELADLLPACEALVVPSTFPEAFGMVAVEAAACGALPVSAAHSGLAEVSDALAGEVGGEVAALLSFEVGDRAVRAIAERVTGWLTLDAETRSAARERLVAAVRERWSWEGVARGVIAAASGELAGLSPP